MRTQLDRSRRNEERFAEANGRIEDVAQSLAVEPVPFLCECSAMNCTEIVRLTLESYRRVRGQSAFFQVPGHDDPDTERVVEDCTTYVVVEKYD